MPPGHDIDYGILINRTIKDFKPVKRLWPVRARLACWILLELAILLLAGAFLGYPALASAIDKTGLMLSEAFPMLVSIAAAFLALRGAVPGREVTPRELALLVAVIIGALVIGSDPLAGASGFSQSGLLAVQLFEFAALPWLVLFWAVRRGVPLQPEKTGALVGLAAFSFALAILGLIEYQDRSALIWLALYGILLTAFSAGAGRLWLDWIGRWQRSENAGDVWILTSWFEARTIFPLVIAASIIALFVVLHDVRNASAPVPDFDLTIEAYEQSLTRGFHSNVPSASLDTMLTAYVEHGMPAYMWDFGPDGFKLAGGRWQPLPDSTPVTYTWFRGAKGALICMMKQTDAFNPPPGAHEEHHDLLFYRYRGFSLCLINIGGYGSFISVIAAPMPMRQFVMLVVRAVH
jgi:hypothetical protein